MWWAGQLCFGGELFLGELRGEPLSTFLAHDYLRSFPPSKNRIEPLNHIPLAFSPSTIQQSVANEVITREHNLGGAFICELATLISLQNLCSFRKHHSRPWMVMSSPWLQRLNSTQMTTEINSQKQVLHERMRSTHKGGKCLCSEDTQLCPPCIYWLEVVSH